MIFALLAALSACIDQERPQKVEVGVEMPLENTASASKPLPTPTASHNPNKDSGNETKKVIAAIVIVLIAALIIFLIFLIYNHYKQEITEKKLAIDEELMDPNQQNLGKVGA